MKNKNSNSGLRNSWRRRREETRRASMVDDVPEDDEHEEQVKACLPPAPLERVWWGPGVPPLPRPPPSEADFYRVVPREEEQRRGRPRPPAPMEERNKFLSQTTVGN